jgi:uncharacterized circularly permuted ATP-grasp superfamily protein
MLLDEPYDEVVDGEGCLRPAYVALRRQLGWDPLRPPAVVVDRLEDRPLGDDIRILPVPLAIEDAEYQSVIRPGVLQRAHALQRFFHDAVLGPCRFLQAGILTAELLDQILAAEGTSLASLRRRWSDHSADEIRMVYGPDLVRAPDGGWVVLEDNVGCVGGSADGFFVIERYQRATGYSRAAGADLSIAVSWWLSQLRVRAPDGVIALLACEHTAAADGPRLDENARRLELLEEVGIEVLDSARFEYLSGNGELDPERLHAVVNFDAGSEAGAPTLHHVLFDRLHVPLLNAPQTGVLGNKALLPFVPEMIRFFCAEDPLLGTPATQILWDGGLPGDLERWVVKTTTGRQGTGVLMPGSPTRDRREAVQQLVRGRPAAAVAQRLVEPSQLSAPGPTALETYRVELRPVAYLLGWQEVYVGEQPTARVVSTHETQQLNNLSQGARYAPVIRQHSLVGVEHG